VRSHQLPKQRRGFEIQHDSMLLTIFSASNYGGACRNKGGVLIFDEHGPAEVKEFYAPQLDQFRAMVEFRAAEKLKDQIDVWKKIALRGSSQRDERKQDREKQNMMQVGWRHLLLEVNEQGDLSPGDQDVIDSIEAEWKRESEDAEDLDSSRGPPPPMGRGRSVITGSSLSDEVDSKRGGGLASASVGKSKGMRKRQLMTHLMRAADGTTSDRKSSGDVGADKTVVDYTHGVVFVEEEDQGQQTDDDIMHQLLAELCKCKGALITAFIAAAKAEHVKEAPPRQEGPSGPSGQKTVGAIRRGQSQAVALHAVGGPSSASTGSEASLKGEEVSHKVSYETWEATLVAAFPKYAALWKQYGPRLVGAAAYPPLARTGGRPVADCKVAYMQFLDRFQVQIAYETFGSFHQALLGRLYLKLLERTRQMPMKELFAYFDPDHSGGVESTELESALTQLDLGLTKQQLQQLILTLGFENGDEVVEPFQAISLLLERIAPVIRLSAHTAGGLGKRTASKRLGSSNFELAPEKRAALDAKLRTLAGAIQSKMSVVMAAVGSETVQSIFAKADADGSGVLSMEEAVNLMREIQSVVEMDEPVASTPEELEDLVRFIDLDGNGQISFVEFLMAFGTTVAAMSDASLKSKNGLLSAPDGEAKDAIVEGVIRQICSALYERMHLLQRAFNYLDVNGDGWVPVADFEHAITLVMQLPSTPKRKRQEAAAAAAAPAPAPATESEAPSDHGKVEASQIEALVASMRGSALLDDLREPPMIDWTGFIKAFEVIDTDLGH